MEVEKNSNNNTRNLESRIKEPIFIFGCPNSGTTILWEALKQHDSIGGAAIEGQDLDGMPKPMTHFLGQHTFRMWAHYLHEQPISRWNEDYLPGSKLPYYFTEKDWSPEYQSQIEAVYSRYLQNGKRLSDKSPAHTLRARFLQKCFPDAKFIAIVRNGYAVSEGIVRKRMYDPERPQFKGLYTKINDAAWQWEKSNEVIVSYQEHNLLRDYMIVRYEDLVENPKSVFAKLLDFCNLDANGLNIPRFKLNLNSYQISRLRTSDIETITRIARPMLSHFDYEILQRQSGGVV